MSGDNSIALTRMRFGRLTLSRMSMAVLRACDAFRGRTATFASLAILAAGLSTALSTDGLPNKATPRRVVQHHATVRPKIVAAPKPVAPAHVASPSIFAQESAMGDGHRMDRWNPLIKKASARFGVPELWIRAVMMIESGGRTMLGENMPITSSAGAMGLMQVMPKTWLQMRRQYGLGADPFDPQDNVLAGTAYLELLYRQYGYPGLFAAYNDGPYMLEAHRRMGQFLPAETTAYVLNIASILSTGARLKPASPSSVAGPSPAGTLVPIGTVAVVSPLAARPHESGEDDDGDDDGR